MSLQLDKRLNLVVPLDYGEATYYVHSTPIGRAAFEANYLVIAKTFSRIHAEGLNAVTGPRVAYMILKDVATSMNAWDGPTGVSNSLVAEIVRLSNVVALTKDRGWTTIPFQEAIGKDVIDEDDRSEVLNAIVFFTVASSMYPRRDQKGILEFALSLWGGRLESSGCTEFVASLKTSTAVASIGARAPAAS